MLKSVITAASFCVPFSHDMLKKQTEHFTCRELEHDFNFLILLSVITIAYNNLWQVLKKAIEKDLPIYFAHIWKYYIFLVVEIARHVQTVNFSIPNSKSVEICIPMNTVSSIKFGKNHPEPFQNEQLFWLKETNPCSEAKPLK